MSSLRIGLVEAAPARPGVGSLRAVATDDAPFPPVHPFPALFILNRVNPALSH
jgi:hypothetical protein